MTSALFTNRLFYLLVAGFIITSLTVQKGWADEIPLTWYEKSNKTQTPTYSETVTFSKEIAEMSPLITYLSAGKSHRGKDIPVLILDMDGYFTPESVKLSGKKVLFVQACIHPGEPVGKDAGLMLFRDIAFKGVHRDLLDDITIVFLPILNVDGHERFGPYNRINQNGPEQMGWRTNALNLNLNRDYLKGDAMELHAFYDIWNEWDPDFFIDTHSTNGADYQYAMTYAISTHPEYVDPALGEWIENHYLEEVTTKMDEVDIPIFQYVTFRNWSDPRSGIRTGVGNPMYSTSYVSLLNRPGLLLETHMLKPYDVRVEVTYQMLLKTIEVLHEDNQLKSIISDADQSLIRGELIDKPFAIGFENTGDSVVVDFLGVEYEIRESDLTGADWFVYHPDKPVTVKMPWFNDNEVSETIQVPHAYVIPVEYQDIIQRLKRHGVQMIELTEDKELNIETYRFTDVQLSSGSREGRQTADFSTELIRRDTVFPAGSVFIPLNQEKAKIIVYALEPAAYGSFAYWGFFNENFERKEYFEIYSMETIAREMIKENPALEEEFKKAMEDDPSMTESPYTMLNWFYLRSPWYDGRHNIYPVGRIMSREELGKI